MAPDPITYDPCDCADCSPDLAAKLRKMSKEIEPGLDVKTPGPLPDPWVHRSSGMRCKTCMWFVFKVATRTPAVDLGRCRRHAPAMNGYPVVFVNDWCGDHKLDETKV